MKQPRIAVVTGAAGFIGSHMVDLLRQNGYRVRGIDDLSAGRAANLAAHRNDAGFYLDVRDIRDLKPEETIFRDADCVFHFAGIGDIVPSIDRPTDYLAVNALGTVHVLEAARHAEVRKFVYAASSSCYGLATELPTTETTPIDPQYPYALSKYLGEESVLHWGQVYRLPVMSIRIFNAYGPRSRTTGAYGAVFGVFLAQKLAGRPFTVVGDGTQRRDFVYVTDVARAFLLAAESDRSDEIYNLGAGQPQSVNRLVQLLGGDVVYLPKRPGEPDCTWADTAKIRAELGWQPEVSFEEGVGTLLTNIETTATPRCGTNDRSRRRPRTGFPCWRDEDAMTLQTTDYRRKIKTREELRAILGRRRAPAPSSCATAPSTWSIPGHVRHLMYASSKADLLIASLTCDTHVSKANFRPFVPQQLRAMNLAAFEVVDFVIIDENPEPLENIRYLQPDYFAKGYEYFDGGVHPKTAEEVAALESYGGEMIFTPGDVVFSSSRFIEQAPPNLGMEKLATLMESEGVTPAALRESLESFRGLRVHVVGDTIVDSHVYCSLIGGITKTPIPSLKHETQVDVPGGAAIVARHLREAGAEVKFSTVLGNDPLKDFVLQELAAAGIACEAFIDQTRPTTQKNVFIADTRRMLKVDRVDNRPISDRALEHLKASLSSTRADAVVFSDFRHGIFSRRTIPDLTACLPAGAVCSRRQPGGQPLGQHHRFPGLRPDHPQRDGSAFRPGRPGFDHSAAGPGAVPAGEMQDVDLEARRQGDHHLPGPAQRCARVFHGG